MPEIKELLDQIGDAAIANAKNEFIDLYNQALSEQEEFVKETAEKTKKWLEMRLKNELTNEEFLALLEARKRVVQQNINTLEIQSRARLEKIIFGIIDIAANKLLERIL